MFKRLIVFAYGLLSYVIFFVTFLYAIGFVGNLYVPRSMDGVPTGGFAASLIVDLALLSAFAIHVPPVPTGWSVIRSTSDGSLHSGQHRS